MDLSIPPNFNPGEGNPGMDSFFSAVAEGLNNLPRGGRTITISSLRNMCGNYASKHLRSEAWFNSVLDRQQQNINNYIENIGYCSEDTAASETKVSIPGRPEVEGRIIGIVKKVKIHVIDNEMSIHKVVESTGCKSVDNVDYETNGMIHIMHEGHLNFKPVIKVNVQPHTDKSKHCKNISSKNPNISQTPGAANAKGEMYEVKLLMLLLLRGLNNTDNFILAKNVGKAGKFDDIVFKYCQNDGTNKILFLQTKHRNDPKSRRISIDDLLKNDDYNLKTLFLSYLDIKNNYDTEIQPIFGLSIEDCEFVLYTNHMLHNDLQDYEQTLNQNVNKMLRSKKGIVVQFTNNRTILTELTNMRCEEDAKKFLEQLHLFAGQANETQLDGIIKQEMKAFYGNNWGNESTYLAVKELVLKWWQNKKHYLTEKDELFVDVIHSFQYEIMKSQNAKKFQFQPETIAQLMELIMNNQVVSVIAADCTQMLSRIQVFQAIHVLETENVIPKNNWIYMTLENFVSIQRQILRSFSKKVLLVIEGNWGGEHRNALKELASAISKNNNGMLLLITDKTESRNILEPYFPGHFTEDDKCTFENLTSESQEEILTRTVILYDRKIPLIDLLGEKTKFDGRIMNSKLLMTLVNNDDIIICEKPPTLSDMETAFAKQHAKVPAGNLLKFLMKSSGGSCRFSIYGTTKRELFRVLNITGGGQECDVISKMIREGNVKLNSTAGDFKQFCMEKKITTYLIEVASRGHIYLKNIYSPKFYLQRRLSDPDKIKVRIDVLFQEEMTDIFILKCESGKQGIAKMLQSSADYYRKHFDKKCQMNQIFFQSSDNEAKAKTKYEQLCKENNTVLCLTIDDETRCEFKFCMCQGILRNLKAKQDYVTPDILFNEAEQDSIFLITNAQKDDMITMLDMWLAHRNDRFERNWENGHIVFNPSDTNEKSNKSEHFFTIDRNDDHNLLWLDTNGSIQGLRRYVNTERNENNLISERDFLGKVNRRCLIIADDPGMGKSTTLTSFSEQMLDSNWVIRVDFRECEDAIEILPMHADEYDDNFEIICAFFTQVRNSNWMDSDYAKEMFKHKLRQMSSKHWQIIMLFDAFDEISNEQQRKIILLLKFLKVKSQAKIWITTRRNNMEELEDALSTFAANIEELTDTQQHDFLFNFWSVSMKLFQDDYEGILRNHANKLIEKSTEVFGKRMLLFMGVPLQLRLLADGFQNEILEYSQLKNDSELKIDSLDILSLYKKFVKRKYDIFFKEKIELPNLNAYITDNISECFNRDHQNLAWNMLFPKEKMPNDNYTLLSEEHDSGLKSVGIIQSQGYEGVTYFIHRTFAEFFVADFIVGNLGRSEHIIKSTIQFLINNLFLIENIVIRRFIDQMLSEKIPIHVAVLKGDIKKLLELLNDNNEEMFVDKLGRSALHLAAQEGHIVIVKVLLDSGYSAVEPDVFGKTSLHYATMNGHKDIIEHIIIYNADIDIPRDILSTALQIVPEIVRNKSTKPGYLSSNVAEFLNVHDKQGKSTLHYSVEKQDWVISCTLIANGADVNLLLEDQQTQILQYAVSNLKLHKSPIWDINFQVIGLLMICAPHIFVAQGEQKYENILQYFKEHGFVKFMEPVLNLIQGSNYDICKSLLSSQKLDAGVQLCHSTSRNDTDLRLKTLLRTAIENEDLDEVRHMIQIGADVNMVDDRGYTPLDCALKYDIFYENTGASLKLKERMDVVRFLIFECEAQLKYPEELSHVYEILQAPRHSLLYNAATLSTTVFAEYLIDIGADVNMKDKAGRTPLYYAAIDSLHFNTPNQSYNMVELLLKKGAIYNSKDNNGKTILEYMQCQTGNDVFKLLTYIDNAFNNINTMYTYPNVFYDFKSVLVFVRTVSKETCLHLATAENAFPIVKDLIHHCYMFGNRDINAKTNQGYTPLHTAAEKGHYDIADLLLRQRTCYNSLNCEGLTPTDIASRNNHDNIVQRLNIIDDTFKAVRSNSLDIFTQNIAKVGYIKFMDKDDNTLIHCIAQYGRLEMAKCIIKFGYDGYNVHDCTALHCAAQYGHTEMVYFLLKNGAVYNSQKMEGHKTPKDLAANEEISYFLKTVHNIFKFAKRTDRNTSKAMNSLQLIKVKSVNAFNAAINCRDMKGNTILHIAAKANNFQLVQFLILNGSGYDAQNQQGRKPEALTSNKQIKDLFECLDALICWREDTFQKSIDGIIKLKDLVNVRDEKGNTILHMMPQYRFQQVNYYRLKYFIKNGANVNSTDNAGGTVLDNAIERQNLDMAKFLLMNGANISNLLAPIVEHFKRLAEKEGRDDILMLLRKIDQNAAKIQTRKN